MKRILSGIFFMLGLAAPAAAQDAIGPVTFVGGPDLRTFAIRTTITRVDVHLNGLEVRFDKRDGPNRWPDNTTPGWSGPLQYSVGLCEHLSDLWYCSAPVETWFGNNVVGGPIQSQDPPQITKNWFYDGRWTPLQTHQPAPGEQLGVFVVAGDARNSFTPVRERSNIVLITLPAPNTTVAFDFSAPVTTPPAAPPPPPTPVSIDTKPVKSSDNSEILDAIADLKATMQAEHAAQTNALKSIGRFITDNWQTIAAGFGAYLAGHQLAR